MTVTPEYKYLEKRIGERFDDLKNDMNRLEAKVDVITDGYIKRSELHLTIEPLAEKVKSLEGRNLRVDRIIGGVLIMALLGLIITKGGIG